jgi:hypothetical protein
MPKTLQILPFTALLSSPATNFESFFELLGNKSPAFGSIVLDQSDNRVILLKIIYEKWLLTACFHSLREVDFFLRLRPPKG